MQRHRQPVPLLAAALLCTLSPAARGAVMVVPRQQQRQKCHVGAGYLGDCTVDPQCWRLGLEDGVRSAADCQRHCATLTGCAYFTFHRTFGINCYLLGSKAKFLSTIPRAISGDPSCSVPREGRICHVSAGYSDAAQISDALPGITTVESCKSACDGSPSCSRFSFNNYLRACTFPNENTSYYPWLIGVISGEKGCELPAEVLKCKSDFAYLEGDAKPLPIDSGIASQDACQKACQQDPRCEYFTFNMLVKRCWLLGGNASLAPLGGTISGKRDCNMSHFCSFRTGSYSGGKVISVDGRDTAVTPRECRHLCRRKKACEYFNWQEDVKTCELQDKGAVFSQNPMYTSGRRDCRLPGSSSDFCREDDGAYVDAVQGLLRPSSFETGDPWRCHSACAAADSCNYFTFSNATRQCWLLEKAYLSAGLRGYWSGIAECKLPVPGHCLVDKGYMHPSTPLPNFGARSPVRCIEACKVDRACHYFTFNIMTRSCWLLGPDAVFVRLMSGVISGPSDCIQTAEVSQAMEGLRGFTLMFFPQLVQLLNDKIDSLTALDCPAGQFDFWGKGRCSRCQGSTRRRGGMTRCIPCENGTYSLGDTDDCYQNDELIVRMAHEGNESVVRTLYGLGTDLHLALQTAGRQGYGGAARLLIRVGADGLAAFRAAVENATACSKDTGRECAREFETLTCLSRAMRDTGTWEDGYVSALIVPAVQQDASRVVVQMLKLVPADLHPLPPNESTRETPLFFAARGGQKRVSEVLIEEDHEEVEWKSVTGLTPLDNAMMYGHDNEAALLQGHLRSWKDALANPTTWISVGLSFGAAVAFWLGVLFLGRLSCLEGLGAGGDSSCSSSDESTCSTASHFGEEEDGYLGKGASREAHFGEEGGSLGKGASREAKVSRGAELLAAKACSPTGSGMMVQVLRFLGVLANLVFPGTFCARYVEVKLWLLILAALYFIPSMLMLGTKTICQKPALMFCFPNSNFLGLHRSQRNNRLHGLLAALRAGLLLPLAIFLGGPSFHEEYVKASEHAPGMLGFWYTCCCWLEHYMPTLGEGRHIANHLVTRHTDLVSFHHWFPSGKIMTFPMKLCPLYPSVLRRCILDLDFNMYLAIVCWFAVLGLATYLWCLLTLALLCRASWKGRSHQDISAAVALLAQEIDQLDDASEIAELGPESEDLPKAVRKVVRSPVKPISAMSAKMGCVLMLLDVALDVNTQLTMFINKKFKSGGLLLWFFFVSLIFELWDGSIYYLRADTTKAIERGFFGDRNLNMQDRERGFEAFGSLLVTTASLLFAIKTPWQFITGILSLLSSVHALSVYIYQETDLTDTTRQNHQDKE